MSDQSKAEETKRVEALYGPFAGGQIDLPTADAEQAIADGWAKDPFATPDPDAKQPEWTQEGYQKTLDAADAYARKLRGEDTEGDVKAAKSQKKPAAKDDEDEAKSATTKKSNDKKTAVQADQSGEGYKTRTSRKG